MKCLLPLVAGVGLTLGVALPVHGEFSSLQIFGDGLSSTTNGPGGAFYHGNRFTNGQTWSEVLAQRQGVQFDHAKNWSFFGHYSPNLVTNAGNYQAPPDVDSTLFVIWVNHADFVGNLADPKFAPYNATRIPVWTNAANTSISNHVRVLQILHGKGARTFVLPNATDVTKVPYYAGLPVADKAFLRQRVVDYNAAFSNSLRQAATALPGTTLHLPDIFTMLDDVTARPSAYGLVNALENGRSIDALSDSTLSDKSLAGPGANYLYWDYLDPSARAHAVIADVIQGLLSPCRIESLTRLNGSNVFEVVNLPIGLNGFVDSGGSVGEWPSASSFDSTNATQTLTMPADAGTRYFRLRFPFAWSWP